MIKHTNVERLVVTLAVSYHIFATIRGLGTPRQDQGEGPQRWLQEGQQGGQEEEEVVKPALVNHDRDVHAQLGHD